MRIEQPLRSNVPEIYGLVGMTHLRLRVQICVSRPGCPRGFRVAGCSSSAAAAAIPILCAYSAAARCSVMLRAACMTVMDGSESRLQCRTYDDARSQA